MVAYLICRVRPSCLDDTDTEEYDRYYLHSGVPFAIKVTRNHGCYTASRSKNNMNWYGDIVAEGVVVQDINGEE